jgi:hypothetical protein
MNEPSWLIERVTVPVPDSELLVITAFRFITDAAARPPLLDMMFAARPSTLLSMYVPPGPMTTLNVVDGVVIMVPFGNPVVFDVDGLVMKELDWVSE